jgi:hypothetical protein
MLDSAASLAGFSTVAHMSVVLSVAEPSLFIAEAGPASISSAVALLTSESAFFVVGCIADAVFWPLLLFVPWSPAPTPGVGKR